MSNIKVSVLCTVYNHEKYLRQALDGFVHQKTSFEYEVLVHDDASTDNSTSIIREYCKKYPNVIVPIYQIENQYSKHISISKTFLFPRIRGKYFAICEGDDYWTDPEKLQLQVDALDNHPECSFSTHLVRSVSESDTCLSVCFPESLKFSEGVLESVELRKTMFTSEFYPFQTSSYLFRRELLDFLDTKGHNFISSCPALDYGWILSALCMGNCYYFSREMSHYRRNSVSSWSKKQEKRAIHRNFITKLSNSMLEYDKLTGGKFSELIYPFMAGREFSSMDYREQFSVRKHKKYRYFYDKMTPVQKICCGLCWLFPPFSCVYDRLKRIRAEQVLRR